MTSSRSSNSTNSWLIIVATLVMWVSAAHAGRKRVVVLDFDGPKAEKFHEDVVKLIKKSHTVISVDKWNAAAEELGADAVTDKNVKKVARKLKVDGVVTAKIEKRRDEYIIRVKLREGTTGALAGSQVQTKSEAPRLDAQAQRDLKDELLAAIDELASNRDGGDEQEEEDTPKKKKKAVEEEEEEEAPKKSGFGRKNGGDEEEEEKPSKKKLAEDKKKAAEEEKAAKKKAAEDERLAKKQAEEDKRLAKKQAEEDKRLAKKQAEEDKKKKKKGGDDEEMAALSTKKDADEEEEEEEEDDDTRKKTASADEEEEDSVEEEAEVDNSDKELKVSPSRRAIDAVVGMSFVRRNLKFDYAGDLGKPPPGYKQTIPVPGAMLDVTFFPLAFGKRPKGIISGIGLNVLYDQVLVIGSRKNYADTSGMQQTADLETKESRWAVGGVLRYPLGSGAKAPVVGGSLSYGRQKFTVEQTLPNNEKTDIPNVHYTMITPAAFIRFPVTSKIVLNGDVAFHAVTNTGAIQQSDQYGAATVTGFAFEGGFDYMLKTNIFVRAGVRLETFGFKFKGDPMSQTHTRDTDADQDVMGARDTYLGGAATVGYLY